MRPCNIFVGTTVLLCLYASISLAGYDDSDRSMAPIDYFSDADTETIVANGFEMTYSLTSGRLLEWLDPQGKVILQYNPEPNAVDTITYPCPGPNCPPIRLYLLRTINPDEQ